MDNTVIGSIIGAVISGLLGIFIALYTIRLRDKEWVRQNVYHSLYDLIVSRENNFQYNDCAVSAQGIKSNMSSSQYAKMDKKIRRKFDTFVEEGQKWDEMWSTVYNRYTRRNNHILDDFIQPLKGSNLISPNNYITVANGENADTFFYIFFFVLIDPSINSADDLYQKMKEYAKKKKHFEPSVLDEIKNKKPEFFDLMYSNLSSLRSRVLSNINYDILMAQGEKARDTLHDLKNLLKNNL